MYWIYPLPRKCLAEIEKRHIVETCFTSHNKWFMFGPQLTPQGNIGRVICNAHLLFLIMFGRQNYVALLCVGLRSVKSGIAGANDNELFCFEHTERPFHQFLIKMD